MQPITRVGYVGLGIMGRSMAANLIKAGFALTVWNRTASKCDELAKLGATVADSPAQVAAASEAVCVNVSDTPDVEAVIFGPRGIASPGGAQPGAIVIDHSTINPAATQRFAAELASRRIGFLDAPVSGGDVGARNATLCIMVGGEQANYERCLPIFNAMGKTIRHMGPAGMGQVCKACNQIAVVVTLLGVCEAMALANKSGLDVRKMIEVVNGGAGASWQLGTLGPKIADGNFAPGFMIDLVLKDLNIVHDAAGAVSLPLPATALTESLFRAVKADASLDGGKLGTQALAKAIEKLGAFRF